MHHRSKFIGLLLAGASLLGTSAANADQTPSDGLRVANANAQAALEEVLTVTATPADQGGGSSNQGTTNVGTVDVQGAGTALGSGYIIPEDGPKGRSTVTSQGIANLLPSANPFQAIALLPGVNQFEDDAVGLSGGTIRVRGMVGAQMGFTINGAPVNDSGNFAVYPQEYIDTEDLAQVWVTQGSTDIDAPHVGASGGNIGIVTRAPMDNFNVRVDGAAGDLNYERVYASLDTGWMGNFKGFVALSQNYVEKWRGGGNDDRTNFDSNFIWQFLPHSSIGLIVAYSSATDDFYRSLGLTQAYGTPGSCSAPVVGTTCYTGYQLAKADNYKLDYDTFWNPSTLVFSGKGASSPTNNIQNPNFTNISTNETNYWPLQVNPFTNAVVTLPVHVQLTDDLRWDSNGYFWYGSGGGGFGTSLTEGGFINGRQVPLAYGDAAGSTNTILLYRSSVTRTFRPGITSKLVYDMDNWTFMGGIWAEHADHRQTAPYSTLNPDGHPCDAWLTNVKNNACELQGTGATGASGLLEYRDFKTDSVGQAVYGEAQGRFFDDTLKINVGVAYRDIHRSMYDYLPTCAVNANDCGNGANAAAPTNTNTTWTLSSAYKLFNGNYAAMEAYAANPHANWGAFLPEFNATYDIDPYNQLFAGAMRDFRTPSNFVYSTFNSSTFNNTTTQVLVITSLHLQPEFTWTYEAGYRFHGDFITASATAFLNDLTNYQASVQLDPTDYSTANIGGVKIYGLEAEAGTKPWHGFTFYLSGTIENSRLASDQSATACAPGASATDVYMGCTTADDNAGAQIYVHTRGKQLVDTPNWLASASIGYAQDGVFANVMPHCYGERATSLLNDEFVPANCTIDASVGYRFDDAWGMFKDATLQFYALNLTNSRYLGEITTQAQTNAKAAVAYSPQDTSHAFTAAPQSYSAYPAAPLFVGVKLNIDVGH